MGTLFSIVIPMYNSSSTIAGTIESVIAQSYSNWELILVDDCSTDDCYTIAESYCNRYDNIRLYKTPCNSGNAKIPTTLGIEKSIGQYCVGIGHDDKIEKDYLQKIENTIRQQDATIVIATISMIDVQMNKETYRIPDEEFDTSVILSGPEACEKTLFDWSFSSNGMAFRKELYQHVLRLNPYCYMNSDEFSARILLFYAEKVVFSDALYTYYVSKTNITHKFHPRLYEVLYTMQHLESFTESHYSNNLALVREMRKRHIKVLINYEKLAIRTKMQYTDAEQHRIDEIIHENFNSIGSDAKQEVNYLIRFVFLWNYSLSKFACRFIEFARKIIKW